MCIRDSPNKGYEFVNNIVGGAIPKEYIEPANQGIQAEKRIAEAKRLLRGRAQLPIGQIAAAVGFSDVNLSLIHI